MLAQGGLACSRETVVSGHSHDVLVDMCVTVNFVWRGFTAWFGGMSCR